VVATTRSVCYIQTDSHPVEPVNEKMPRATLERDLIEGFLAGEKNAYETVNAWVSSVLNLRSWHWTIRAARDDIKQEVLAILTENFAGHKYRGEGLRSYVSSVTKFTCLKAFDNKVASPLTTDISDPGEVSALDKLVRTEELLQVRRFLRQLDSKCRKILVLRYYKDLSHKQIAGDFGIDVATSRQWLKRCIDKIRNCLQKENKM
jgi:RNA polymerase sigma factor (sigma-70 family)